MTTAKTKSNLSQNLQTEVERFFEYAPPARFSRNLRKLLLSYLSIQQDGHNMNIEDLLIDIQWFFDLLDIADEELKPGS